MTRWNKGQLRRVKVQRVGLFNPSERSLIERASEELRRHNSTFKVKVKRQPKEQVIAGLAWPDNFLPEERPNLALRPDGDYFRNRVENELFAQGWKFYHNYDPVLSDAGFPDEVCWREREVWLELKVRDIYGVAGRVSPAQREFHATLIKAGCEVHIVTWPDSWDEFMDVIK